MKTHLCSWCHPRKPKTAKLESGAPYGSMPRAQAKPPMIKEVDREQHFDEEMARFRAAEALMKEASVLLEEHKDESALFLLSQAEAFDPYSVQVPAQKAWIYLRRGQSREAIAIVKRIDARAPYYVDFVGLKKAVDYLSQSSTKQT